jgi:hypothetical protein
VRTNGRTTGLSSFRISYVSRLNAVSTCSDNREVGRIPPSRTPTMTCPPGDRAASVRPAPNLTRSRPRRPPRHGCAKSSTPPRSAPISTSCSRMDGSSSPATTGSPGLSWGSSDRG